MIECVDGADRTRVRNALSLLRPEAVKLASAFFAIPEYHDEGRLPAGKDATGDVLGPNAQIYASPFLGDFSRRAQIYEQGRPGLLAAIVVVQLQPGETIPLTYANLNLQAGVNCIWLYLANLAPTTDYQAFVSHPGGAACDRAFTITSPLPVATVPSPGYTKSEDYPAAARFDVDRKNQPVLGFKCLNAFCEVGATLGTVRAPWGTGSSRRDVIKSWHDEQYLAIRDVNDVWRPTKVRATIVPEANIDRFDEADFQSHWRHVANVKIHDPLASGKYYDWGMRQGKNEIWLTANGTNWTAKIRRPSGTDVVWGDAQRMIHYDAVVPPTARFRWTVADEGIWVPCGNACCRVSGH